MTGNYIVTCSGVSSTGKLTTQAVNVFMHRNPGIFDGHFQISKPGITKDKAFLNAGNLLVIDGCSECCALKKLSASGCRDYLHIIATDAGILKRGMEDPNYSEIELLVGEIRNCCRKNL
ncbi:hypothetical protein F1737_07935 [Methanoplanus sp. FWC-SCC4]|uniref:Zinc-binding protein n=1 Tax=Methanochimaera problematica TaxID=2609417 RepID=A0AA97FEL8_9EURY|nr:putative zinc-binding protein [Methanoplanus sp. FWC-SCC4]WOF16628.1 hypothetical protein F1737_07935 [Methanoplanus sp. FWC-SCC4]